MSRDRRLVLAACYLTILLIGDNSTAVMAALPAMTSALGLGPATIEWIVNAYLLASAVFIVLGGEAADRFGARRSSAAGVALFAFASLAIALAGDGVTAVGARALQGVGAALAVPGTLAAVSGAACDSDRGRVIGAWTGFLMLGFSIGPLVGGAVTHYAGWRLISCSMSRSWSRLRRRSFSIPTRRAVVHAAPIGSGSPCWRSSW